jgi:hypothetical protein
MTLDGPRILGADCSARDQFRELTSKPANRPPICRSGHGQFNQKRSRRKSKLQC